MQRIVIASLSAVVLLLGIQQQASAWSKLRISVGFNISWEGAGNSFLFGLIKGGPAPGDPNPEGGMPQGPYSQGLAPGGFGPMPQAANQPQAGPAQAVGYFYPAPDARPAMAGYQAYGQPMPQAPSYWYAK